MARASISRTCDTCANLRVRQKLSEQHVASDQTAYKMFQEARHDEDAQERNEKDMFWKCVNSHEMRYPVVPEIIQHCRIYDSGSASAQAYVPELKNPDNRCRDWKPKPSDPVECGFCKHYQKNDPWKGVKDIEKWIASYSRDQQFEDAERNREKSRKEAEHVRFLFAREKADSVRNRGRFEDEPYTRGYCRQWGPFFADTKVFNADGRCPHFLAPEEASDCATCHHYRDNHKDTYKDLHDLASAVEREGYAAPEERERRRPHKEALLDKALEAQAHVQRLAKFEEEESVRNRGRFTCEPKTRGYCRQWGPFFADTAVFNADGCCPHYRSRD